MEPIFTDWRERDALLFGHQPQCLSHRLDTHPLFSRDALAELIEKFPPDQYILTSMGKQGDDRKLWRRGTIGKLSGHEVISAIEKGRLWINLLRVNTVDGNYAALLDHIYEELHKRVPGYPATFQRINGILISSPRAQVYYHFDTAGQNLWQIAGTKKVYLYPVTPPFVTKQEIERVTLYHDETSVPYQPWFDEHATVFDLQPGKMVSMPLNMPHRIENGDELSVSMTSEFLTRDIKRHVRRVSGEGLFREWGVGSFMPDSYAAKLAAMALASKSGLLAAKRRKELTFELDRDGNTMVPA